MTCVIVHVLVLYPVFYEVILMFIGQCEFKNKGIMKTKIVIFLFTEVVRDEGGPVII